MLKIYFQEHNNIRKDGEKLERSISNNIHIKK